MDSAALLLTSMTNTSQKTIKQLEALRQEIKAKQESITQQRQAFEKRLDKVTAINKSIKVDSKQKAALHEDCARFQTALDNLIKEIDTQIASWNKFLEEKEAVAEKKEKEQLFFAAIYMKQRVTNTKKFIKRTTKNVAVAHSRFIFGFDSQQKQLNYLELLSTKH